MVKGEVPPAAGRLVHDPQLRAPAGELSNVPALPVEGASVVSAQGPDNVAMNQELDFQDLPGVSAALTAADEHAHEVACDSEGGGRKGALAVITRRGTRSKVLIRLAPMK
jgi:hypothetical protein